MWLRSVNICLVISIEL